MPVTVSKVEVTVIRWRIYRTTFGYVAVCSANGHKRRARRRTMDHAQAFRDAFRDGASRGYYRRNQA